MKHLLVAVVAIVAISGVAVNAIAKPKNKATITEADLRICMGFAEATPQVQIATCTKVIGSGKVKHPHESEYYAYRAGAYLASRRPKEAVADLHKAIAIHDKPEFRFHRALAHMASNDLDAAMKDLDVVVEIKKDFAAAYFMRGVIHYRLAAYDKSTPEFDKAYTLLPSYAQALYARGASKLKANDTSGRADIDQARGMRSRVDGELKRLGIRAPG